MKKKRFSLSGNLFFWQLATLVGLAALLAGPVNKVLPRLWPKQSISSLASPGAVNAQEIYPLFTCPCCDQPLDKEDPCCEAMIQMIDFIDQKIEAGAGKDAVILETAQEFGLERLADKSQRSALRQKLLANAPKDAPKIIVPVTRKDLGQVSLKRGTVVTEFVIKNEGQSDLVIDKLSSSCGCTSASLVYQGVEGPRFYMAGHKKAQPDPNWKVALAPGAKAQIKVYYDPTVHPDLIGPVTRTVSVHSNDPVDFETKLTINLNQVQ